MAYDDLSPEFLSAFPDYDGHETVRKIVDADTGLTAFIGVHNRALGPALGGCRMYPYAGGEADAIRDVLRLSRGMTYKNALAGLPLGGGKSVILGDPFTQKTPALMRAMGRAVQSLDGHYITAEDSGTSEADMQEMGTETSYVVGLHLPEGDTSALGGNPSPVTAYGVYMGIKAAVRRKHKTDSVAGLHVVVQGLGSVGYALCEYLHRDGAHLTVTDTRPSILDRAVAEMPGTKVVTPDQIFAVEGDIFAPCALGAQINDETVPQLRVGIVAGAANNQLATKQHDDMLADRGILYVPDYVINAGGVIAVAYEYFARTGRNPFTAPLTRDVMMDHVTGIGRTIDKILALAETQGLPPGRAADRMAESIFMAEKIRA
jgi:leucine dehydrogenase